MPLKIKSLLDLQNVDKEDNDADDIAAEPYLPH